MPPSTTAVAARADHVPGSVHDAAQPADRASPSALRPAAPRRPNAAVAFSGGGKHRRPAAHVSLPGGQVLLHRLRRAGCSGDDSAADPGGVVDGTGADGWFKMFEFFEVPSQSLGAIGPVAQGTDFDWARQDTKPGLLNLNLIIDEEVFFSVLGSQSHQPHQRRTGHEHRLVQPDTCSTSRSFPPAALTSPRSSPRRWPAELPATLGPDLGLRRLAPWRGGQRPVSSAAEPSTG